MRKPKKPKKRALKVYEIAENVIDLGAYIDFHYTEESPEDDFSGNEIHFVVKPSNDEIIEAGDELVFTLDESFWDFIDNLDLDGDQ